MNITIMGAGNVGTVLAGKFREAGHAVNTERRADIVVVAIPDDALPGLKDQLRLDDVLIVHTAGSVTIEVLSGISSNYGVLYPLQSIRKESPPREIPFLIDANTEQNRMRLKELVDSLSCSSRFANDVQRGKIHLAAVVTNNFINHLLALTEHYCEKEQIDHSILMPLLEETILRFGSARDLQTGPAQRRDLTTIQKQREMLVSHPSLLKIYNMFTENIISLRSS